MTLASYVLLLAVCRQIERNPAWLRLFQGGDMSDQTKHFTHVRRNTTKLFFSNFDRTFLETVKRPLAHVFSIDRGPGCFAKGVEKTEMGLPVFGEQWAKLGKNANFQTKNAHIQAPISNSNGGRSSPIKNHFCKHPKRYNMHWSDRRSCHRKG